MFEPFWRQVSAHVLSGGPCALRHGLCGVIVAQSGPSYSTPVMLGKRGGGFGSGYWPAFFFFRDWEETSGTRGDGSVC